MTVQQQNSAVGHDAEDDPSVTESVAGLAAKLLPVIARKKAASNFPTHAGSSFFYELGSGWETRVLERDDEVTKVSSALQLEEAFTDAKVKTILIPADAAITREVALRICKRHGAGKTVFFEVSDNEKK